MVVLFLTATLVAQSLMGGLPIDGISCDRSEGAVEHIHSRLQIFDRGHGVEVPEQIGMPQTGQCLYWIHTHSGDGYIHIESPVKRPFTLGQFFDIWGEDLGWTKAASVTAPHGKQLSIWVNGTAYHGKDPRSIVLSDRENIVIQNGPPFAKPLPSDWSKL
ncbi:MAG: hypothetical protein JO199_06965 [Candidatus Eremiobacteraeota bacterium]|nr:hypothetical protein [Candidatus Eremiobacteraeota bacterium]